ncbi:hypothetical protein VKT23_013533 [Stygiomarasmius scandens]|uniref:Uncharacterized protein n=1 Tax=Marasmiellus scandens TaxID=2682957 RepID=A0ABR1J5D3_9AGAR
MWTLLAISALGLTTQAYVIPNDTESLNLRSQTRSCPGYQFGIIDVAFQTGLGGEGYAVMDGDCNQMIGIVTPNPCTEKLFACSPHPIKITDLYFHDQDMKCEENDKMGNCWGKAIQYCCGKGNSSDTSKDPGTSEGDPQEDEPEEQEDEPEDDPQEQ